ncbi:hypothetical protein M4951_17115 [Blastopirellula sp. J2-11]|uniref:hypothetical protein n=1 Tax=Blastopirellula sp. J2-11 TaxID=2943192 RepID=UPI0021C97846|nr:hypothetical protein [Blastopirellula sp. J2-11]UUO05098.1 hypothetical protein M4951_17115 [Blastopirellula sp. J2-11]
MLRFPLLLAICLLPSMSIAHAEDAAAVRGITPGKVIIPTEKMRRIWGELVSVDLATRTGTFRAEGEDAIYKFAVMPYAEMLHHATNGALSDFRIGERAIFRLHVNEQGEWYWLTYIQDEMNMLRGHKEYYIVESLDPEKGRIGFTWAKADKSFVRQEGLFLETDKETKFWKAGKPASFADIKPGDLLRAKTHGIGKGQSRIAWHVFLDDESLEAFRDKQVAVHSRRMAQEGLPGYVDRIDGGTLELTLFREGSELAETLLTGRKKAKAAPIAVQVAPTDASLKPSAAAISATVVTCEKAPGALYKLVLQTTADTSKFREKEVARVWVNE